MKRVISFLAIDKSIALNLFGRGWQSIAGLITLWVIGLHLTLDEQGFYFTFLSVLGLQVFFELGLGYVILQFASHEVAYLTWNKKGCLEGDILIKERLRSFFRYSLIWGLMVSILIMAIIYPGGRYFFGTQSSVIGVDINWQIPWFLICLFSSGVAFLNIVFCFLEGCGFVKQIAVARVIQYILASISMWALLKLDGRLYCLPLMLATSSFVGIFYLFFCKRKFVLDLLIKRDRKVLKINCIREIWPIQWRIALSWISGYLVYQFASPVVFSYHGPKAAGQIGMSITIGLALTSFSMAWISTKASRFGALVAKENITELDKEFFISTRASLLLALIMALTVSGLNYFLHMTTSSFSERLLPPMPFFLLMLSSVASFLAYALALYIRAHKIEPLVLNSLFGAAVSTILLLVSAKFFSLTTVVMGYFFVSIMMLILTTIKFIEKKKEWQQYTMPR